MIKSLEWSGYRSCYISPCASLAQSPFFQKMFDSRDMPSLSNIRSGRLHLNAPKLPSPNLRWTRRTSDCLRACCTFFGISIMPCDDMPRAITRQVTWKSQLFVNGDFHPSRGSSGQENIPRMLHLLISIPSTEAKGMSNIL